MVWKVQSCSSNPELTHSSAPLPLHNSAQENINATTLPCILLMCNAYCYIGVGRKEGGQGVGHQFQFMLMRSCCVSIYKSCALHSALQVVHGRLPESVPSVAKRSSNPNEICVGAQLSTIAEADADITEEAAGLGIETDAATAAAVNEGELTTAETRLPLAEDVQRAKAFQVHRLVPVAIPKWGFVHVPASRGSHLVLLGALHALLGILASSQSWGLC